MNAYLTSPSDYKKHRHTLNKTLSKLRQSLGETHKDTKNYKTTNVTPDLYNHDTRYGDLLLFTAERDLLYALETKSRMEMNDGGNQRALVTSKMKRATHTLRKLLEVTVGASDEERMQLYYYSALAHGQLAAVKKQWDIVLNTLSIARCVSDYLKSVRHDLCVLLDDINDTVIDVSLKIAASHADPTVFGAKSIARKHCHDNLVGYLSPGVELVRKYDASCVTEIAAEVSLIKSVEWRGHVARLYNDEVAYRIMGVGSDGDSLEAWARILELHEQDMAVVDDDDDKTQDNAIVLTYIKYHLFFCQMKRDYSQAVSSTPIEQVKLFGRLVASTQQIQELPGVYRDEALNTSLERLGVFFTARKNVSLAVVFTSLEKYAEGLSVLDHTRKQLGSGEWYLTEFPYEVTSNAEFAEFRDEVERKLVEAHVMAQFSFELNTTNDKYSYLIENVEKCTASLDRLVNMDGLQPVLCKPVLFDVAYNYVDYGERERKRRGLFGIFG